MTPRVKCVVHVKMPFVWWGLNAQRIDERKKMDDASVMYALEATQPTTHPATTQEVVQHSCNSCGF